jgi:AcrR family transcriptional regulator
MRKTGTSREATERAMREAGVHLIAKHGYEAMNLRMLAKAVGIQAGSLYNYISNKQQLLFSLMRAIIEELTAELDASIESVEDPLDRLKIFVKGHVNSHTRRKEEVFIGNMELRSLTPKHYKIIVNLRRAYEQRLIDIIRQGRAKGYFSASDERIAAFAILAMLTGVCTWYSPKGRVPIDRLADLHYAMVLGALGAPQGTAFARPLLRTAIGPESVPKKSIRSVAKAG